MALPDRFEQAGVVLGAAFLLSLPTSVLASALGLDPLEAASWLVAVTWFGPGAVVGVLVATDRLPVTYHEVWRFSLASYVAALALLVAVFRASFPAASTTGVLAALGGMAVGVLVARPPAVVRRALS